MVEIGLGKYIGKRWKLLVNVGPKPDGTIAEENVEALEKIGKWYLSVKEAFDGTVPASTMVEKDEILMSGSDHKIERDDVLLKW